MTWTLELLRAALHGGPPLLSGLADATVKATALLLAAALATLLVRRASAASRHFVWSLAAAGALALPLLVAFLPSWRVAVLPPEASSPSKLEPESEGVIVQAALAFPRAGTAEPEALFQAPLLPALAHKTHRPLPARYQAASPRVVQAPLVLVGDGAALPLVEGPFPALRARHAQPPPAPSLRPGQWIALLWAAGCALFLLKILAGRIGVRLLSRRALPVTHPDALAVLDRLRRRMGIRRSVTMLQADRATLPMTWGTLHPVVLLPADAHTWTADRLELVLLHELAHVRRFDALTQLVAQLACAVYWFHPLVWLAARKMRALREYACDDHVLAAGTRASAYAGEMLEMVRSLRSDPLAPASATLAMARRSHFEGRLMAILDPNLRRSAFGSRAAGAIGALGLMVLMPLAALQPTAAAQQGGPLPRLTPKESERRKSAPAPAPVVAPVPVPAAPAAPAEPPGMPVPAAPPAPSVFAAPAAPPAPPAPPAAPGTPVPAVPAVPALPAAPADDPYRLGCLSRAGERESWKIVSRDDHFRCKAIIDGGRCKVSVEATGKLFFTPNLSGLAGLSPGAAFHAEEINGGLTRSYDMRADAAGKVTREWKLNGQPHAVDAEAKMFLAALLAQVDRASGYPSAHRAGEDGDVDAAQAAAAAVADARADQGSREAIDRAVAGARGDDELLRVLVRAARDEQLEDAAARKAYLRACDQLRSGEARARALKAFLMAAPIDPDTGRAVLASALAIRGDDELLSVLKTMNAINESELVHGPLVGSYLDAVERLRSDEAVAYALVALLHPEPVAREGVMRALDLTSSRVRSDEARHRVLVEVTDHQELDPQVKARLKQLVASIKDSELQADARKRMEHSRGCDDEDGRKIVSINGQLNGAPIHVQVDTEALRREAQRMAREAERVGREAAREAERIAQESARHEQIRDRARQEADEARRQWSAEGEKLRVEAERLKAQARKLSEQMRERARKLKQKLSRELPPDELEELNLDELDDLDVDL
ncbi:MAG TPA: M56 family metallopeptidase [Myxococcaceae bacterium]|jgi:beta-lactamase regulating signal transducer with metallopeptidase domain